MLPGQHDRLSELPCRVCRKRPVADLPLVNQIVKGPDSVVYRRRWVRVMGVIEVEVVGAETAQGPFDLLHDESAAQAGTVRATAVGARLDTLLHFAGNNNVVAMTLQGHAEDLLCRLPLLGRRRARTVKARLIAVRHRGVEKVDAQVQGLMHETDGISLLWGYTESSRAQREA